MSYDVSYGIAAAAEPSERATFIRRTYSHLAGAILAFIGLETVLVNTVPFDVIEGLLGGSRFSWLFVLGAFMGASWLAQYWARSQTSRALQYCGLALYVVAEAVIFLPLLIIATQFGDSVIPTAGILTLATFGGLTITVFVTRKDFSFLAPILSIGGLIAFGLIVVSIFVGFDLGVLFAAAMVVLMSGYILYYTSNVMHHYRTDQYVAAALALFAAIATLFWYILQIVMMSRRR
ncbi:MAG TPA: permease [Planctomycetales bacterium]|jgi:FtsH-binding integral membrane protein|nr:permease [Planctomycetales bacterium]